MNTLRNQRRSAQSLSNRRSRMRRSSLLSGALALLASAALTGCAITDAATAVAGAEADSETAAPAPSPSPSSSLRMGNGEKNWIVVDGVTRERNVLSFKEVRIDGNGWLVMHPFEDGKPNGDKYVASTYVESGTTQDVDIEVLKGVTTGEMFIVMLHRDLNENQVLDFVFVDDRNVMDKAVFEGSRMIGHAIPAP